MRAYNKEFGKRSRSKKAQVRTIIELLMLPVLVLVGLWSLLGGLLLFCCYRTCFVVKQKQA
jgi:hypothetical protein